MNFIHVLVIAVAILTILAAVALVFGSSKTERTHSLSFFVAAIGEVIWAVSIAIFLSLGNSEFDARIAPWLVKGIYIGAIIMDSAILAYVSWKYRWGKILTTLFSITGIALATIFIYDPSILYSEIILTGDSPSVSIDTSKWFYYAYIIYFCLLIPSFCLSLFYRIRHTSDKKAKRGYLFFLIGLAVAGGLSGVFDLIMPLSRYDLIWVGPLAIGLIILGFYFAILKYKMVPMNASWLKTLSSVVIISGAFISYLLIFHLVFIALFKVPTPSYQVVLLNFIMIAIVLLLMPAFSEIIDLTKSLISTKQIDLPYIVKKISVIDGKKSTLKEISSFLAEHMHFSYIGFIIDGKFYVADDCKISAEVIKEIEEMPIPQHGAWQNTSSLKNSAIKDFNISRIAVLTGSNGEVIGQMIFGKSDVKSSLDNKELAKIMMIVSLIGVIIEDGGRSNS
ncbi:MAG: hypothetical protein Q4A36_02160 [Candidatus Saccharibacteria bacterium]|nr:hypothetical protein [Candidatus Saccharibacteria bacterium]